MVKAGIIVDDKYLNDMSRDLIINSLTEIISFLYNSRFKKIYIITPYRDRHNIVKKLLKKISKYDLEIVFRELYGEGFGGGLISLSIFIKRGEKILVIDPYFKYPSYLYQYFSVTTDKARYPILFISIGEGSFYISLHRDKVIHVSKKFMERYVFVGTAIYTYSFFSHIKEYLLIYPDLHMRDLDDILNIYVSKGGIIKAKFLSPSEWKIII